MFVIAYLVRIPIFVTTDDVNKTLLLKFRGWGEEKEPNHFVFGVNNFSFHYRTATMKRSQKQSICTIRQQKAKSKKHEWILISF